MTVTTSSLTEPYRRAGRDVAAATCSAAMVWILFVRVDKPADLQVFLRAGRTVWHGGSPYVDVSSSRLWSGHAFVYPYFTAWLFAPLSALSATTAGVVYYAMSVAALVVTVHILSPGRGPVALVAALTAEPVVRSLQLGTLNVWLLLGLAVTWRYRERKAVVVTALATVVVAKLFLLPMIAWLIATRRTAVSLATGAVCAAAIVSGCVIADFSIGGFGRMLTVLSAHEGPHSSSIAALLTRADAAPTFVRIGPVALAVGIVAAGWVAYRRTANETITFLACLLASIAASPIVWSHYYTLLLLVPLVLRWRPRELLLVSALTWLIAVPDGGSILAVLHPFPGAGWIWAAVAVTAWTLWQRRAGSGVLRRPAGAVAPGP